MQTALGKTIDLGPNQVEVSAVIRDLPSNTHFTFEALVSWDTFDRADEWTNINAYTYVRIKPGTNLEALNLAISTTASDYLRPMADDYKFSFRAILQRIDEIHLSGLWTRILSSSETEAISTLLCPWTVLFVLTGLFNYLNLALTELTLQLKTISILKAFGGYHANHQKIAVMEAVLVLSIAVPCVIVVIALTVAHPDIFPAIDHGIWLHPVFLVVVLAIVVLILSASGANGLIASGNSLRATSGPAQNGLGLRKFLVASQLAVSMVMIGLIAVIIQQFNFVNEADKGFESSHVIVIKRSGNAAENEALENSVRDLPGVQRVAGSSFYPDGGVETKDVFDVETSHGRKTLLLNFIFSEGNIRSSLECGLSPANSLTSRT